MPATRPTDDQPAHSRRPAVPDLNELVSEAEKAVRDGAYVAVGFGVLAFQRAQVQRRQLAQQLEKRRAELPSLDRAANDLGDATTQLAASLSSNAGATRAQVREMARTWDRAVAPARRRLDERVDALQERLPSPARDVLASVRAAAAAPESRLRAVVGLD